MLAAGCFLSATASWRRRNFKSNALLVERARVPQRSRRKRDAFAALQLRLAVVHGRLCRLRARQKLNSHPAAKPLQVGFGAGLCDREAERLKMRSPVAING